MRSVPASLTECARRQAGLVTRAQAVAHGLSPSTVDRWARSRWSTVLPGVYDLGRTRPGTDTRPGTGTGFGTTEADQVRLLARAARLKWGDDVVVSERSAAALLGYPLLRTPPAWMSAFGLPPDPPAPRLTVTVPPTRDVTAPGVRVHRQNVAPADMVRTAEAWTTSPVRTAADMLRTQPLLAAVAAADGACRRSRTSWRSVQADVLDGVGRRGAVQARNRIDLVDPACESPLETMLRLLLHLAGLPCPASQVEVRADGRLLGRADFGYPAAGLVMECDGRTHHEAWSDGMRDRRRQNRLVVEAGLRVLRFTHDDLTCRPVEVATAVRTALARARS